MEILRLPAVMDSMHQVQAFVVQHAEGLGAPPGLDMKLELALEEMAVNVISYAYGDEDGDLEVGCEEGELEGVKTISVSLRDWGHPFDPLQRETPDTDQDVEERPIGGLGIHLVQQMADSISYEREGDSNVLTMVFKLELKLE